MKLDLINFKCFEKAQFVFDSRCILLSGNSGSGKTSVLAAIHFAFTGEGRKIVRNGKTKCSVKLTMDDGSIITRTKGPCRLLMDRDNAVYEDSAAQAIIDRSYSNWELGYVSQRLYKSFVMMTPADKLGVIEKMSFGGLDIESVQTRCKELINRRKESMMLLDRERSAIETLLKDIGCVETVSANKENLEYQLKDLKKERCRIFDRLMSHRKYTNEIKDIEKKIKDLSDSLNTIEIIDQSDVDETSGKTMRYNAYIAEKKRLRRDITHSGMEESEIDSIIDDMKLLKDLDRQIEKLSRSRKDLDDADEFKKTHVVSIGNCPACNTLIGAWNGKLLIPDSSLVKPTTVEESEKCEQRRMRLASQVETLSELECRRDTIAKQYPDGIPDNIDEYLKECQLLKNNDRIWMKCKELECEKPEKDLQTLIETMKERRLLESELKSKTAKREKLLSDHRSILELDYDGENAELQQVEEKIRSLENDVKDCEIAKQWNKVTELRKSQKEIENKLPAAIRLQSLIKTAEQIVLNDTLADINLRATIYLDRFFSNEINATLAFEGHKVDLKITLNGSEFDINSLSGGEFARVVLAFAIAMAEMNAVGMILLDESFASLDSDTAENVLEAIKENYAGMIIIVAHQTTKGVFDQVIEL